MAAGLELVDTPGTGSVHHHNSDMARHAIEDMDLALFVLSASPPVSATERELLRDVGKRAIVTLVVLLKADLLDRHELDTVTAFTASVVGAALSRPVRIQPVSARQALDAYAVGDAERLAASGVPELTRVLEAAASDRVRLLRASVAAHAARLATTAATDAELTATAAQFDAAELSRRRAEFVARLAEIHRLAAESEALLRAEIERLVTETSQQATTATPEAISTALNAADVLAAHPARAAATWRRVRVKRD